MENEYLQLGFKRPEFLENQYGIKIYIGTKGKDDWSVEIPNELAKKKSSSFNYDKNVIFYLVSEEHALAIARVYTELAKKR